MICCKSTQTLLNPEHMTKNHPFYGQKFLVTGASGFIGTHLCNKLSSKGAEVHGVSRAEHTEVEKNVRWWQCDLSDIGAVRKIFHAVKPDIIFHLASHVVGARNIEIVLPTFHSNLTTTVNLLTVATEAGCHRIMITGSLEEPEESRAVPSSPYAAAKYACSAYARMFYALYKTPVALARLFMVYGPGQQDLRKLIPYVTLSLLRKEAPKLSSGQRLVDWIYVEDVVEGLLSIAQTPDIEGYTLELGSGTLVSVRNIVDKLASIINSGTKPLFGHITERPMEQVRVANTEDTFSIIGWKTKVPLEKGLGNTVKWYREQSQKPDRVST